MNAPINQADLTSQGAVTTDEYDLERNWYRRPDDHMCWDPIVGQPDTYFDSDTCFLEDVEPASIAVPANTPTGAEAFSAAYREFYNELKKLLRTKWIEKAEFDRYAKGIRMNLLGIADVLSSNPDISIDGEIIGKADEVIAFIDGEFIIDGRNAKYKDYSTTELNPEIFLEKDGLCSLGYMYFHIDGYRRASSAKRKSA